MPDRDLIAEGQRLLPAPGELLTSGQAFDLAEWAGLNLGPLLDKLRWNIHLFHEWRDIALTRKTQRDEARAELAAYRKALADIRAADPALFEDTDGRGRAYETYGSGGDDLREAYLAAVAPLAAWETTNV
ncbi:hypothetical protein [Nocardia sp. NPDC059239]|uniref:hypothetical protein n=1 Tax=unclassified Nocardia TaxID=2637762 RepID=UPI0036CE8C51